jgi:hypothetical protein
MKKGVKMRKLRNLINKCFVKFVMMLRETGNSCDICLQTCYDIDFTVDERICCESCYEFWVKTGDFRFF